MGYQSRTVARAHQAEALTRLRTHAQVFALLMGTGTGKSKVILDEWGERVAGGDLQNLLIIAPAGAYANWWFDRGPEEPSEATKHLNPELRERMLLHHWASGGGVKWLAGLKALLAETNRPRMFVVNVEALSSVDRARDACKHFIASGRTLVCLDESTRCKNPSALRTRQVLRLGEQAVARRIATGLVTPRSPLDLFSQFYFLDPNILGHRNFSTFRSYYAITQRIMFTPTQRYPAEIVIGFRNLEELQARIEPFSYSVKKEQCLDLPPKVYTTRDVGLTDEQRRMYRELKDDATTKLEAETYVTVTSVITQIMRLHQLLCGHLTDELGNIHDVPERRTATLLDVLSQHDGKAIIWVSYDHTVRRLRERLEREYHPGAVAAFWGGNRSTRLEEEARFKTDPDCRFLIATPGAGGLGNTWIVADLVIYYSNNYDLELRAQSEDRAHRYGQTKSVTYVDLVARGTVDEKILQVLRAKIDLNAVITGDTWKDWVI